MLLVDTYALEVIGKFMKCTFTISSYVNADQWLDLVSSNNMMILCQKNSFFHFSSQKRMQTKTWDSVGCAVLCQITDKIPPDITIWQKSMYDIEGYIWLLLLQHILVICTIHNTYDTKIKNKQNVLDKYTCILAFIIHPCVVQIR